jgi:hypothetical protein
MGVHRQRTKMRVRLCQVEFAPGRRHAHCAQNGTEASWQHGRNEPEALRIRRLASAGRRDARHADDGFAIESDKGRLSCQNDAKQPPEHHFQALASPFGIASE